jgi:uncharacterized protein (TIGR02594 family)
MNWLKKLFKRSKKEVSPEVVKKPEQPKDEVIIPEEAVKKNWLEIAKGEIGVKEFSGSKHEKRIIQYHSATTLKATEDEVPWCSSFVSWCLEEAGIKSTKNAWARSYLSWGVKIDKPVVGCVVVFSRGVNSGHVAFYMGEGILGIQCLGGNQGNKVCISTYPKSRLLGYRLPK